MKTFILLFICIVCNHVSNGQYMPSVTGKYIEVTVDDGSVMSDTAITAFVKLGYRLRGCIDDTATFEDLQDTMTVFYPFWGQNSSAYGRNFIDPDSFKITFVGSPLLADTGLVTGASSYANTNWNPVVSGSQNMAVFIGLRKIGSVVLSYGNLDGGGNGFEGGFKAADNSIFGRTNSSVNDHFITTGQPLISGNFLVQRLGTNSTNAYSNGVFFSVGTPSPTTATSRANLPFFIGACNQTGTPIVFASETYKFFGLLTRPVASVSALSLHKMVSRLYSSGTNGIGVAR